MGTAEQNLPWLAMLLLGAGHGINPGMGWLFAVALGMQEGSGRAVWHALLPLAIGHAVAVAAAIAAAAVLGLIVPVVTLQWLVAGLLVSFGCRKLMRSRHPRFGGMRIGSRDLAIWSFLMASAHGAGLMVMPFVLDLTSANVGSHTHHAGMAIAQVGTLGAGGSMGFAVTLIHTAAYLAVSAITAWIVYSRVGVRMLSSLWFNMDRVWAIALILTGIIAALQ
jgi:hypothetical protein